MNLTISARNFELTDALNDYARKKLSKLNRYAHVITGGHLVLEKDKSVSIVEITLLVKHASINSKVTNNDLYLGINEVLKKIERQLVKYEEKFRARKRLASRKRQL